MPQIFLQNSNLFAVTYIPLFIQLSARPAMCYPGSRGASIDEGIIELQGNGYNIQFQFEFTREYMIFLLEGFLP